MKLHYFILIYNQNRLSEIFIQENSSRMRGTGWFWWLYFIFCCDCCEHPLECKIQDLCKEFASRKINRVYEWVWDKCRLENIIRVRWEMNLFYIMIVNLWFSILDQKDMRDFIKNEISLTGLVTKYKLHWSLFVGLQNKK